MSNKPAFISGVKLLAVSCSRKRERQPENHQFGCSTSFCFSSTKETNTKDEIVVEMKTDTKTEESVLLKAVNGDKKDTSQQMTVVSMTSLFHTHTNAAVLEAEEQDGEHN